MVLLQATSPAGPSLAVIRRAFAVRGELNYSLPTVIEADLAKFSSLELQADANSPYGLQLPK